jgi:uncharacterized membrane protein YhaH (DUF805 family)
MMIGKSVRSVIFKFFVLRGRAGRSEFWWWVLAYLTTVIVAGRIDLQFDGVLFGGTEGLPPFPITTFVLIALLPAHIAVSARRLHDAGRSAWWLALGIVPVLGWMILLWYFVKPSVEAVNRHGRPPPGITYF